MVVSSHVSGQDQAIQEESPREGAVRVTAGFVRGVNEIFALLECYATFADSCRRLGATYLAHIEE